MWEDWLKIIKNKQELTLQEGYYAAVFFLSFYAKLMNSKQIKEFASKLTFMKWEAAVKKFLKEKNAL